ncbi:LRR domain containing protein [Trema orientale]|uniref:LRR domain containing protein n=1 Tax=Trema orientale TaxID=63057 RepID=A0A2P5E0W1_TREOI|nr:LRR domain containing protein [Trema orientale]
MVHLEILNLRETGVRVLHPSIKNLLGLVDLILERCNNLVSIPDISSLNRLQRISLSGCPRLENVPPLPDGLRNLNLAHLGHCNISKVSDGMSYFSSLEVLDLRGHILHEIPISIKQLSSLIKLHICDCKNLKSLPELPDFLEFLDATGCTSLETIVNPRAASGFTIVREYLFYNCLNLHQKARNGIIIEFQNQTLRTAVAFLINLAQIHQDSDDPRVSISCPGNKIPKWFTYQSRVSSINIKLPPHWHNDYFMGFAFCVVVAFDGFHFDGKNLRLDSHMHFKTGSGESHYVFNRFNDYWRGDILVKGNTIFNSSHLFMWHRFQNYYGSIDAEEVSIFFDIRVCEWERPIGHFEIKKCGIRLLYFQDGEELYEQYKLFTSSDINKEPEPSGSGRPNIDSDEPQFHKRTKW